MGSLVDGGGLPAPYAVTTMHEGHAAAAKGSTTMTRRKSLALVVSLISLVACLHVAPVSACELDGADTCERSAVVYVQGINTSLPDVGIIAAPATSDIGITTGATAFVF